MEEELNIKQEEFCRKYVEFGGNGTQAYKEAYGCEEETAKANASRLLTNANVKDYINELLEDARNRNKITVDKIVNEYAKLAFFNPADVFTDGGAVKDIQTLDKNVTAAIKSIKIKEDYIYENGEQIPDGYTKEISFADKKAALDSLGKFLGMFVDKSKVEVSGDSEKPLTINIELSED